MPARIVWYSVEERYRETLVIILYTESCTVGGEVEGVLQPVLPGVPDVLQPVVQAVLPGGTGVLQVVQRQTELLPTLS